MHLYRIELIRLQPLLLLAQSHDDAADILSSALINGLGNRPDADFDVTYLKRNELDRATPLEWGRLGYRGIAWSVDGDRAWEFQPTVLKKPDSP